jgi:hypothetical protein
MRTLCARIQTLLDRGNVDAACAFRERLAALCRRATRDAYLPKAQALCASLYLVHVQRKHAARVLRAYVRGRRFHVNAVRTVAQRDPLAAAALASTAADVLFRLRAYPAARDAIREAERLIQRALPGCRGTETAHGHMLKVRTLARAARISWCIEHSGERARAYLREAIEELERVANEIPTPQRLSLEAFILDMWACWDWMNGLHIDARAKAYRALAILRRPELRDSSRTAHALLTVCRVESSSVTRRRHRFVTDDLDAVWKLFGPAHELRPLPMILKAQILGRVGSSADALDTLSAIRPKDHVQEVECGITRIWFFRRDAAWDKARAEVERLKRLQRSHGKRSRRVPRRFEIELLVQEGAVLLESGAQEPLRRAITCLTRARELARRHKRVKMEIAAETYLALAHRRADRPKEAHKSFVQAQVLLATTRSTYLSEYFKRHVEPEFRRSWVYIVPFETSYKEEVARFRQELTRRLVEFHGTDAAAAVASEVNEKTVRDNRKAKHRKIVPPLRWGGPGPAMPAENGEGEVEAPGATRPAQPPDKTGGSRRH